MKDQFMFIFQSLQNIQTPYLTNIAIDSNVSKIRRTGLPIMIKYLL